MVENVNGVNRVVERASIISRAVFDNGAINAETQIQLPLSMILLAKVFSHCNKP